MPDTLPDGYTIEEYKEEDFGDGPPDECTFEDDEYDTDMSDLDGEV